MQITGESHDRYMQFTVEIGGKKGAVGISHPGTGNFSVDDLCEAFENGALWADDNPQPWIEVTDWYPEVGKHVLAVNADGWIKVGYWDGEQWWWADGFPIGTKENGDVEYSSYCAMQGVVAWMPIPKLPDCVKPHYYGIDYGLE